MIRIINNRKGFTLIELLVVLSIISLLSSVVLSSLSLARAKARDAKRASEVKQLKVALEMYQNDNGFYPSVGADDAGYSITDLSGPLSPYIKKIPTDPTTGSWSYVRGPVNGPFKYGLLIYREVPNAYCGTGMDFNPGWWGIGSNLCPF